MAGREWKAPPNSADILVCFPSRAHLTLKPKPVCSPSRPVEPNKHQHHHHHRRRPYRRQASPLLWAQPKPAEREISEPTSPRVTCAGQIRVRPKPGPCKTWQSVMEEIERLHNNKIKHGRRATTSVMQFLSCLRRIRFDFRCFGSFPTTDLASDVEEDDQEEKENEDYGKNEKAGSTVFSKWFMVLQEEQSKYKKEIGKERESSVLPPPNALLLMRCRSAPAKSWAKVQEAEEEEKAEIEDEHKKGEDKKDNLKVKEGKRRKSLASLMREENDFDKLACGIAKETCVVGGLKDPFSRSRSWKR